MEQYICGKVQICSLQCNIIWYLKKDVTSLILIPSWPILHENTQAYHHPFFGHSYLLGMEAACLAQFRFAIGLALAYIKKNVSYRHQIKGQGRSKVACRNSLINVEICRNLSNYIVKNCRNLSIVETCKNLTCQNLSNYIVKSCRNLSKLFWGVSAGNFIYNQTCT